VLTGESLSVDKDTATVAEGTGLGDLTGAALMGTVVQAGTGRGVVVSTGPRTEFGKIATGLSTHHLDTEFQVGLRRFSMLLVYVAGSLTTSIFIINVALHRPIIDALLFSLAIAVGITPQLLPAVVSSSLAARPPLLHPPPASTANSGSPVALWGVGPATIACTT